MFLRIVVHSSGLRSRQLLASPLGHASIKSCIAGYSTDASHDQDTLIWPPPGHAVEENSALQRLLHAQQARKELEQAAAERVQSGSTAQSSGTAHAPEHRSALLAVHEALKQRSIERPIQSASDLSDLRLVDIRPILAQLGLQTSGSKSLLVDRLWSAILDEGSAGTLAADTRWEDDCSGTGESNVQPFAHVVTGEEVAEMLRDAKTDNVRVLDVRRKGCDFTDEFVIATARSKLHAQTAAQAIVYQLKQRCQEVAPGVVPSVEGLGTSSSDNSQWLVVDCGSVVAHVFEQEARGEYDLDSKWGDEAMSLEAA